MNNLENPNFTKGNDSNLEKTSNVEQKQQLDHALKQKDFNYLLKNIGDFNQIETGEVIDKIIEKGGGQEVVDNFEVINNTNSLIEKKDVLDSLYDQNDKEVIMNNLETFVTEIMSNNIIFDDLIEKDENRDKFLEKMDSLKESNKFFPDDFFDRLKFNGYRDFIKENKDKFQEMGVNVDEKPEEE